MYSSPEQVLKQYFGHSAFRPGQEALISSALHGEDALGVLPTGGGKSLCYQVPALMMDGIALVISPLLSLMKDQVAMLKQSGVAAAYINSFLTKEQCALALKRAAAGWYRIVYVAPERLTTSSFMRFAQTVRFSLIAVDEAHCVSQWGQDFRPSYLAIADFVNKLPNRPPLLAFTATATPKVQDDIVSLLQLKTPKILKLGFDRPNLFFSVLHPERKTEELLFQVRSRRGKSGIVYCSTRKNVDKVCDLLRQNGYVAARYHAGLPEEERRLAQEDFSFDRAQIMVATNAFGMGIDKGNVSYVIHYNMPRDMESYYQEAGRAGRDGEQADCVLFYSGQDVAVARWMIDKAERFEALTDDEKDKLRTIEHERLQSMVRYCFEKGCLRRYILGYFGETVPDRCDHCSVCVGRRESAIRRTEVSEPMVAALRLLRNHLAIAQNVPAYVILSDISLREMAAANIDSLQDMQTVQGIGEARVQRYGPFFLQMMQYIRNNQNHALTQQEIAEKARRIIRERQELGQDEAVRLRAEFALGYSISAMAKAHNRCETVILAWLKQLGLKK